MCMYSIQYLVNFLFILFSISFTVHFIAILQKWPYISRFGSIFRRDEISCNDNRKDNNHSICEIRILIDKIRYLICKIVVLKDKNDSTGDHLEILGKNSIKIMTIGWLGLFIEILLMIFVLMQYTYFIEKMEFTIYDFLIYGVVSFNTLLVPKFFTGVIHGLSMAICPCEFMHRLKESYRENRTIEDFDLAKFEAKHYLYAKNGDEKSFKDVQKIGYKKLFGNVCYVLGCWLFIFLIPINIILAFISEFVFFTTGILNGYIGDINKK